MELRQKSTVPGPLSERNAGMPPAKDRRKDQLLRMCDVTARTGLSISSIYRRETSGRFPRRLHLGLRAVAWYQSDIEDFIADPAGYRWQSAG